MQIYLVSNDCVRMICATSVSIIWLWRSLRRSVSPRGMMTKWTWPPKFLPVRTMEKLPWKVIWPMFFIIFLRTWKKLREKKIKILPNFLGYYHSKPHLGNFLIIFVYVGTTKSKKFDFCLSFQKGELYYLKSEINCLMFFFCDWKIFSYSEFWGKRVFRLPPKCAPTP